jgi:protoporphyrinogen oxidase
MYGHLEVAGGGIAGLTAGWSVRVHVQDASLRIPVPVLTMGQAYGGCQSLGTHRGDGNALKISR